MKSMSSTFLSVVGTALAILGASLGEARAESVYVATTAFVEHPALDAVRDGIRDTLNENGYSGPGFKFTYESAQGNPATAAQIARHLVGESPNVIVAISTPSAQAVAAATKEIPIVFAASSDPLAAQLVSNYDTPGGNITGASDNFPPEPYLDMMRVFLPDLKKIGVPYNPGEANSVALLTALKQAARAKDIEIIEAAMPKSSDAISAARSLVGKVDAIYTLTDNTVISALEAIVKVGKSNRIPVFSSDTASVERGALAALGFNYYDHGKQVGEIVVRILKGEKPGDIPVVFASNSELYINSKVAPSYGITIPEDIAARAAEIIR